MSKMYLLVLMISTVILFGNTESVWKLDHISVLNCENKCFGVRRRYCEGDLPCVEGAITENFSLCPYPAVCPAENYDYGDIVKRCTGLCDLSTETVGVSCKGDSECTFIEQRFCIDHSTCTGEWGSWKAMSVCNASCNGYRQRQRRCMLVSPDSTAKLCLGGKGRTKQIEEIACNNHESCTETNTLPTEGRNNVINCASQCQNSIQSTSLNAILEKCGHKENSSNRCNATSRYTMSCGNDVSTRECSVISDNEFPCDDLLEWSDWGEWKPGGSIDKENRYRYRWCGATVSAISSLGNCRRVMVVDQQCRDRESSPDDLKIPIWSIIIIIILLLLILLLLVCFLVGKRRSESKAKDKINELPPPIEMKEIGGKDENSEDVFENDLPLTIPPPISDLNQGRSRNVQFLNNLTVMNRLSTASEHLYEKISTRKSRIFSRSSSGSSTRPISPKNKKSNVPTYLQPTQGAKQANEYTISSEDAPNKKDTKNGVLRSNHKNKNEELRISVTITDPDGIEVGKNVYKANSQRAHPSRSTNLQISEKKKQRWSRVPSPRPKKKSQDEFFGKEKQKQRDYVKSVKYTTGVVNGQRTDGSLPPPPDDIQMNPEVKIVNNPMKNIFRFFGKQKVKKVVHKYDDVPVDIDDSLHETKPRILITSAKSSSYEDDDRESHWSDSTFDDMAESDDDFPPLPVNVQPHTSLEIQNPKSTNRKKRRKNKSRNGQSSRDSNRKSSSSTVSPPVGASVPDFPPADNAKGTLLRTGNQEMYNYPKNSDLTVQEQQLVGYIDMSPRNSEKYPSIARENIKSWINLGTPPKPEHSKNNSNASLNTMPSPKPRTPNGQPKQVSTKRVTDLDEKYMASIPISPASRAGSLPTDQHGYLHLSFTEH